VTASPHEVTDLWLTPSGEREYAALRHGLGHDQVALTERVHDVGRNLVGDTCDSCKLRVVAPEPGPRPLYARRGRLQMMPMLDCSRDRWADHRYLVPRPLENNNERSTPWILQRIAQRDEGNPHQVSLRLLVSALESVANH